MLPQWRRTIWPFTWWATALILLVGPAVLWCTLQAFFYGCVFFGRIIVKALM